MITSTFMGFKIWNLTTDAYDHGQLADNWAKVDEHDHSSQKGKQIPTGGIADAAVTQAKIAPGVTLPTAALSPGQVGTTELAADAVTSAKILNATIATADIGSSQITTALLNNGAATNDKLDQVTVLDKTGISSTGVVRRGALSIATTESTTATTYSAVNLTTPDRLSNVVLPTNGIICVGYQAIIQNTVTLNARAAIFVGANQLKVSQGSGVPVVNEALGPSEINDDGTVYSTVNGLSNAGGAGAATEVTTGEVIGQGMVNIFAAAGTYDISVQFKNQAAGTLTVKNRHLWVYTIGF